MNQTIYIGDVIDDIFSQFTPKGSSNYPMSIPKDFFGSYNYSPPKYPVSNYFIDDENTSVIEIAVTGFSENEITIEREGKYLIVEGKKQKEENQEEVHYFYHNIAKRDFQLSYKLGDAHDTSNITSTLDKGILTITVPLKEESKPVKEKITIQKIN